MLTLMLSSAVYADFSISTESSEATVCIGSTATIVDKVTGTAGQYSLKTSGTATDFTTTVPTGFSFNASQNQNIYSYLTVSSKIKPGTYALTVKVSSGNATKESAHTIIAKDCHGTSLSVDGDKKACPCEKVKYKLTLENSGEFSEKFSVVVEGTAKEWTNLSKDKIELDSNESETFYAYVQPPCNVNGKYSLTFKAVAEASLAGASTKAELEILPCYEYGLGLEKNYSICENEKLTIPLEIDNQGTADNSFAIVMEAPDWAKLASKSIDISAGTKKSVEINAQPPFKTQGNFTIKVETMASEGNVKKNAETTVFVRRCYGVDLNLESKEDKLCKAEKTYEIAVSNLGEFDAKYDLKLDGPEWAKLDEDSIKVDANENETIKLTVEPKDAEFKAYNITIEATDSESNETDSESLMLEISKPEDCYKAELTTENDAVSVGLEKSKTVFLMLKNNGLDEATYTINLEGKGAKFAIINPNEITLKPGESETLYLYISPPLFTELGEYNLSVIAKEKASEITSEKTIVVKISEEGGGEEISNEAENATSEKELTSFGKSIGAFFSNIINSIKDFFTKLFMVQLSDNETLINATIEAGNLSLGLENASNAQAPSEQVPAEEEITAEVNETAPEETEEAAENETIVNETAEGEENEIEILENESATINESIITGEVISNASNAQAPSEQVPANETEKIKTITNFNEKMGEMYQNYKTYIIGAGVILLLIIIITSGLGKAIVEFFEEEE